MKRKKEGKIQRAERDITILQHGQGRKGDIIKRLKAALSGSTNERTSQVHLITILVKKSCCSAFKQMK